ncbi:OLC1v1000937C1 [Oldenlandia corymbosa var. corymbosa]|uniref:OLC1v1000937C1 n=1 Tax=Oldenlandia corymbosa var. corymbosa TaxID=529605 RepID=A0AAV1D4F2_OLDCO|nr:OLC1v1000937C1 [Oldenlandia corymbosa var. corymbosa]
MADGGSTILDGSQLRALDLTLPSPGDALTGAQLLELAESRVSKSFSGLALPENLKSAVLRRVGVSGNLGDFRLKELDPESAATFLRDYVSITADELKADPIVLSILDGKTLQMILDDEDDFAMLAENLFTDLDTEDRGKIGKSEIHNALLHMGIEMGIPPVSEFPLLSEILKKHEAVAEEELGQAQFAQLLQPVLQDLANALGESSVVVKQNVKIINGSKLRKVLADEKCLDDVAEKLMQKKLDQKDAKTSKEIIRSFLDENCQDLGLPPLSADEMVVLLYDTVFSSVEDSKVGGSENVFKVLLKEILENFAEQLEATPVFYDSGIQA